MNIWRKYYPIDGLEVTIRGGVRRTYDDCRTWSGKGEPQKREWHFDKAGNPFILIKEPNRMNLRVDFLVAYCYLGRPLKGQRFIIHKDGDRKHCWADNLKWATPYEHGEFYKDDSTVNTPDGYRLVMEGVLVSKDGNVKMDGKVLPVGDSFYDPDMDREAAIDPFVSIPREISGERRTAIEKLVVAAYLPQPAEMQNPVILHIDNDYKNCSLDNLEWVEEGSETYQEYLNKRAADIEKRIEELNPYPVKHLLIK